MVITAVSDPASTEGVFAVGKIPPTGRKPPDIDTVLALLVGERKQNRLLIQRNRELGALLEECEQFCGDVASGDVDDPAFRAEELETEIRRVLEEVGR